jgi:hypothetical protein
LTHCTNTSCICRVRTHRWTGSRTFRICSQTRLVRCASPTSASCRCANTSTSSRMDCGRLGACGYASVGARTASPTYPSPTWVLALIASRQSRRERRPHRRLAQPRRGGAGSRLPPERNHRSPESLQHTLLELSALGRHLTQGAVKVLTDYLSGITSKRNCIVAAIHGMPGAVGLGLGLHMRSTRLNV